MEPFPHIRVEGSPIERGRSYGEQAADRVRRSIDAYREVFAHYAGWDWATVTSEASLNGHTLIGQNWDWLLHSFDTVVVLEAKQVDGPDFVTVVEAGLLAKTGMNSSGIGLVTNALVTDLDRGEPGVPYHLVLRGILDAENLSDALAIAQRGFRSSSANYLAATTDGLAVDIEATPGDFSALHLLFPTDGVLLHTNHFLAPKCDHTDVSLWVMPDSPFRLERLGSAVARRDGKLSID